MCSLAAGIWARLLGTGKCLARKQQGAEEIGQGQPGSAPPFLETEGEADRRAGSMMPGGVSRLVPRGCYTADSLGTDL